MWQRADFTETDVVNGYLSGQGVGAGLFTAR
jgi:hypothetical protein